MFTTFHTGNWIPLTWFSLALDYQLGGLKPQIYHWNNLLLHLLNVLLVYFLARKIFTLCVKSFEAKGVSTKSNWIIMAASLTALIFGIHPIHVESVAWASERKDVLYGVFYLSSLLFYLGYASDPELPKRKLIFCFIFFLLALLSKPMAISLPLVLLVLDFWPLNRLALKTKDIFLEKAVFFIPLFIAGILALFSQSEVGATPTLQKLSVDFRVMNAFHAIVFYFQKLLLPFHFSAIYPILIKNSAYSIENLLALLLVLLISILVFYFRKPYPGLIAGWCYYLITVAPVLGIVQVGAQAAADRYAYLPTLSLIMLFSSALAVFLSNLKPVFAIFAVALSLFLGSETYYQVGVWKNSISLWENAVRVSPDPSEIAYSFLGFAFRDTGKADEALTAFDRSISLNPNLAIPRYGKGLALSDKGLLNEAVQEFKKAIVLDPQYASPHTNLCVAYQHLQMYNEAIAEAEEAIRLDPQSAQAYNNLGVSYGYKSQIGEAAKAFQQAVALEPGNPMYQGNLAAAYSRLKK